MRITALALRAFETWEAAARPLDTFIREVRSVLNGGVTLSEQMAGEVKRDVRYIGGENITITTRVRAPLAVLCLSAHEALTGDTARVSGASVLWVSDNGAIEIASIASLSAGTDYLVTLWIVEG